MAQSTNRHGFKPHVDHPSVARSDTPAAWYLISFECLYRPTCSRRTLRQVEEVKYYHTLTFIFQIISFSEENIIPNQTMYDMKGEKMINCNFINSINRNHCTSV